MRALFVLLVAGFHFQSLAMTTAEAGALCQDMNVERLNDFGDYGYLDEDVEGFWTLTESIDLSQLSNREISDLPTHVKQKIIITAKRYISIGYSPFDSELAARFSTPSSIENTIQAMTYLRAINETPDEELSFLYFENRNQDDPGFGDRINWLSLYPGAQAGFIYPDRGEGLQILAEISDGWVTCVEAEPLS